jgi:hypothetical protein
MRASWTAGTALTGIPSAGSVALAQPRGANGGLTSVFKEKRLQIAGVPA